ncbi:Homeobox protein HD-10 [Zancudomyces culisetae]|uniref:Homeobox protein HD-10 n=1 Tax=Zancudomyces culisetae TaxID=1213189 RepID=A0A1R1PL50_ZANCU|nr:Homeobox protein HD-10 [Zancudomyces culisetae]|eukprot:OMH81667.1 Homeobox protein HD-10 [Zancudomyces culisetae]
MGELKTAFYNPYQVKHRRRTTKEQFQVLESTFQSNNKPPAEVRREIAAKLSMTPREVQVWFQNRRAKEKNANTRAKPLEKHVSEIKVNPASVYGTFGAGPVDGYGIGTIPFGAPGNSRNVGFGTGSLYNNNSTGSHSGFYSNQNHYYQDGTIASMGHRQQIIRRTNMGLEGHVGASMYNNEPNIENYISGMYSIKKNEKNGEQLNDCEGNYNPYRGSDELGFQRKDIGLNHGEPSNQSQHGHIDSAPYYGPGKTDVFLHRDGASLEGSDPYAGYTQNYNQKKETQVLNLPDVNYGQERQSIGPHENYMLSHIKANGYNSQPLLAVHKPDYTQISPGGYGLSLGPRGAFGQGNRVISDSGGSTYTIQPQQGIQSISAFQNRSSSQTYLDIQDAPVLPHQHTNNLYFLSQSNNSQKTQ